MEDKERLKNQYRLEEAREKQLNKWKRDPGQNPGTGKGYQGKSK